MDVKSSNKYLQDHTPSFHSHGGVGVKNMGRPGFSFSIGSRKNIPSKWEDAEKWVINGHESPAHGVVKSQDIVSKKQDGFMFHGSKVASLDHQHCTSELSDLVLKAYKYGHRIAKLVANVDKFTNEVEPVFSRFKCPESTNKEFVLKNPTYATTEVVHEAKSKDTGTEMTPTGSSTTSRCPTPIKSLSPPRHNTPEGRLVPLGLMDQSLQECHLAKLQPWTPFDTITSKWSSRDEEDEELSKSLREFEMNNECVLGISGPRPSAWEEKSEPCIRYQIEEARIKAWVNLQNAKAEAESRKLEMKIQKMRSRYEEKFMKKMTLVQRKAEELRNAAKVEHSTMVAKSNKTMKRHPSVHFPSHRRSCGCLVNN
ncbi:remorin [Tanacetum coccineum]